MQSRDQAKTVHGDAPDMRISAGLVVSLVSAGAAPRLKDGARGPREARRALILQEIRIFRVLFNIGFDERALGDRLQAFGAHLVERALDQPRADTLAAKLRRHF